MFLSIEYLIPLWFLLYHRNIGRNHTVEGESFEPDV